MQARLVECAPGFVGVEAALRRDRTQHGRITDIAPMGEIGGEQRGDDGMLAGGRMTSRVGREHMGTSRVR